MSGRIQVLIVGFLIMMGYFAASFVAGIINGILFTFLPVTGALSAVGMIISLVIFAFLLGGIVMFLVKRFGN